MTDQRLARLPRAQVSSKAGEKILALFINTGSRPGRADVRQESGLTCPDGSLLPDETRAYKTPYASWIGSNDALLPAFRAISAINPGRIRWTATVGSLARALALVQGGWVRLNAAPKW